ncbi:phosphogluconate dehydratase [Chiayiivirga flava]|uniref:Phosphogluconate dehydratase n=1 Tax=Chiayiivirga flava TaxID=659595 RepID=A0A7W8DAH8_9GAMM|nr:phosphogluconate dehydratase [Chiayiivirga flava]MBB5209551.1 phosphogluconate dehydratase [Chiayiivirga flava]
MPLHPAIAAVTDRIVERSRRSRAAYLALIESSRRRGPNRQVLSCGNLAHGFAACGPHDKNALKRGSAANIGIVTAYNDMLSAHQPFETYPALVREAARAAGATAQVAGGVPAMCDGVTQGRVGMELSLFSRDVIAQSTAIALSHDMFDAALMLGVCDKIVPGLLIGALSFGHLPTIFVPAGPMTPGLPNKTKSEVRERYAAGEATREELLEAESASYHGPGTCTFYGTANSNQILLEAMGLQLPGTSFINPGTTLRDMLTVAATERAVAITALGDDYRPIGRLIDERAIVNAIVALLATGGSTNHAIHWVAVARAAGIVVDWNDFDRISHTVPLLSRIYPNGEADVNRFHAAGGIGFVFRELLDAGFMHEDIDTIVGTRGLRAYTEEPGLRSGTLQWQPAPIESADSAVLRPAGDAFEAHGGLRLLTGNLGRALIKVSAVKPEHRRVQAPAVVVDDPQQLRDRHKAGLLPRDFVAVVRYQGPRANGMPEMHVLTPLLGMLQNQGRRVALVTDGRLSGASGKVPAAIHVTPEAARGGVIAKLRDGDPLLLDGDTGELRVLLDDADWLSRPSAPNTMPAAQDIGRALFAVSRAVAGTAEEGGLSISCGPQMAPASDDEPPRDPEYDLGAAAALAPHEEKDA